VRSAPRDLVPKRQLENAPRKLQIPMAGIEAKASIICYPPERGSKAQNPHPVAALARPTVGESGLGHRQGAIANLGTAIVPLLLALEISDPTH
jgi:hypothetical protein